MERRVELVLQASDIPLDAEVRKVTGKVTYTLRNEIVIHSRVEGQSTQRIPAAPGALFLVGEQGGNVTAIPGTLQLVWVADPKEAVRFIARMCEDDK